MLYLLCILRLNISNMALLFILHHFCDSLVTTMELCGVQGFLPFAYRYIFKLYTYFKFIFILILLYFETLILILFMLFVYFSLH